MGPRAARTKKRYSTGTHAYDPATQRWEKLPDLPAPLGYAATATVGNRLFVMGGYSDAGVSRKIFELQKSGGHYAWSVFGDIGVDRVFASAVAVGHTIYVVGGTRAFEAFDAIGTCCTSKTATKTLLVYNVDHPSSGWRQLSSYPGKARWLPAVTTDGKSIWLMGGLFSSAQKAPIEKFDEVLRYDIQECKWTTMPALPADVAQSQPLSSLSVENQILIFTNHTKVWRFDPRTGRYAETTPKGQSVAVNRFFWLDRQIVGAGGESLPEGPRRRSPWTFTAKLVGAGAR